MPNYAVHDGATVVNVIVADTQAVAEEITGLSAVETTGEPWIDWTMEAEGWRRPSPFPSWSWNGTDWEAPVPDPQDGSVWDEASLSWIAPPPAEPAP